MNRNSSVFTGLLLILAGIIVLLLSLGYGSWSLIWQIWRLWPLILIIIGIRILWHGPSSQWFSFGVLFLLGAGIIALLIINPKTHIWPGNAAWNATSNDLVVHRAAYPGVTSGNAKINFGGGMLTVSSDTTQWAEGRFGGFKARTAVKSLNNRLAVTMKQSGHFPRRRHRDWDRSGTWNENNPSNRDFHWDVQLSPDLDWKIDLKTGASKAEVNLANLRVKELDLKMGAGDLTLTLGDKSGDSSVKINSGASKVKVILPKGLGVKVKTSGALLHTNLGSQGWIYNNHEYHSPEYDEAASHLMIDLNMGVGDFELVRK